MPKLTLHVLSIDISLDCYLQIDVLEVDGAYYGLCAHLWFFLNDWVVCYFWLYIPAVFRPLLNQHFVFVWDTLSSFFCHFQRLDVSLLQVSLVVIGTRLINDSGSQQFGAKYDEERKKLWVMFDHPANILLKSPATILMILSYPICLHFADIISAEHHLHKVYTVLQEVGSILQSCMCFPGVCTHDVPENGSKWFLVLNLDGEPH